MTYLYFATFPESSGMDHRVRDCTSAALGLLVPVLVLPGIVALVCAANMVGTRQRYALGVAAIVGAVWIILAVLTRVLAPGTTCVLGIS